MGEPSGSATPAGAAGAPGLVDFTVKSAALGEGKAVEISIPKTDTVEQLKARLRDRFPGEPETSRITLIYAGSILRDPTVTIESFLKPLMDPSATHHPLHAVVKSAPPPPSPRAASGEPEATAASGTATAGAGAGRTPAGGEAASGGGLGRGAAGAPPADGGASGAARRAGPAPGATPAIPPTAIPSAAVGLLGDGVRAAYLEAFKALWDAENEGPGFGMPREGRGGRAAASGGREGDGEAAAPRGDAQTGAEARGGARESGDDHALGGVGPSTGGAEGQTPVAPSGDGTAPAPRLASLPSSSSSSSPPVTSPPPSAAPLGPSTPPRSESGFAYTESDEVLLVPLAPFGQSERNASARAAGVGLGEFLRRRFAGLGAAGEGAAGGAAGAVGADRAAARGGDAPGPAARGARGAGAALPNGLANAPAGGVAPLGMADVRAFLQALVLLLIVSNGAPQRRVIVLAFLLAGGYIAHRFGFARMVAEEIERRRRERRERQRERWRAQTNSGDGGAAEGGGDGANAPAAAARGEGGEAVGPTPAAAQAPQAARPAGVRQAVRDAGRAAWAVLVGFFSSLLPGWQGVVDRQIAQGAGPVAA